MKDVRDCNPQQKEELKDVSLASSEDFALDIMERKVQSEALDDVAGLDADGLSFCQTLEDIDSVLSEQQIKIPDVDEEYARFSQRMSAVQEPRKVQMRPLMRSLLAIAAVFAGLLLVFTFWKHQNAAPKPASDSAREMAMAADKDSSSIIFKAIEEDRHITLQAGSQVVPINEETTNYESVLANLTQDQKETVIIRIPRGKVYSTTLSDGTQVWLNADSKLLYPLSFKGSAERRVKLEGEAYFKVTKDASHPFIVEMNDTYIKVLGTEFNVRTRETGSQEVTLVSGSISVKPREGGELMLKPGQQFVCSHLQISVNDVDTDPYIYWKNGSFYFDNANIDRILTEIGRWYNVNVQLENKEILNYKFHFIADRDSSLSQIINLLNQMDKVTIRKKGNTLFVY